MTSHFTMVTTFRRWLPSRTIDPTLVQEHQFPESRNRFNYITEIIDYSVEPVGALSAK